MKSKENTLVMIKPDAPARGLVDRIAQEILSKGFTYFEVGHAHFDLEIIKNFYQWDEVKCPDKVEKYMCKSPIPLWIIKGEDAVAETMEIKWRLRRTLCDGSHQNLMHCSSTPENFIWEYELLKSKGMIVVQLEAIKV